MSDRRVPRYPTPAHTCDPDGPRDLSCRACRDDCHAAAPTPAGPASEPLTLTTAHVHLFTKSATASPDAPEVCACGAQLYMVRVGAPAVAPGSGLREAVAKIEDWQRTLRALADGREGVWGTEGRRALDYTCIALGHVVLEPLRDLASHPEAPPSSAPAPGTGVVCGNHWHGLSGEPVDGSTGCPWCLVAELQAQIAAAESAPAPSTPIQWLGDMTQDADIWELTQRRDRFVMLGSPMTLYFTMDDGTRLVVPRGWWIYDWHTAHPRVSSAAPTPSTAPTAESATAFAPAAPEVDLGEVPERVDLLIEAATDNASCPEAPDGDCAESHLRDLTANRIAVLSAVRSLVERARGEGREDAARYCEAEAAANVGGPNCIGTERDWALERNTLRHAAAEIRALTPSVPGAVPTGSNEE